MTNLPNKVLVLGSDTRSFLTVIRSLGRAGKEVHVAWCARDAVAISSTYVHAIHSLPRPPSEDWQEEFLNLLDREQFDLIIPCNDPSILPLHQQRDAFAAFPIYLINAEIFETVMDKAAVNQIAARAGLRLPKEIIVRTPEEIDAIDGFAAPYVLKPTQSFVTNGLSEKNHVVIERDRQRAKEHIRSMLVRTSVATQEYFEGYGLGVEFIAREGEILTAFQHARLHEPPTGGGSSYRISCDLNAELLDATQSLVAALGYTGVGMAEYRYNSKSKDWIFVELNSRFWGSLPLAVACGADFPAFLYDMWCNDRTEFPKQFRTNRVCRNLLKDIQWLRQTLLANRLSASKQLKLAWQLLCEARYPLTLRESSDTITWDDTAPGINELSEAAWEVPQRINRKVTEFAANITTLRSRSRKKVHAKVTKARNVLFVCKGNICRSPFADLYTKAHPGHLKSIESCGYFPKSNRPSPANALLAAAEFGVDLSAHRSIVISQDAVDRADAILVFDQENQSEIGSRYPLARAKTFMLGMLLESAEFEIIDPYGGTVEDFRTIYSKISKSLDCLAS